MSHGVQDKPKFKVPKVPKRPLRARTREQRVRQATLSRMDYSSSKALRVSQPSPDLSDDPPTSNPLEFSTPRFHSVVYDRNNTQRDVGFSATLRGIFLQEDAADSQGQGSQDVTCYRRNILSVSGQLTLPQSVGYIWSPTRGQFSVASLNLEVGAIETTEGNSVKMITVPAKSSAEGQSGEREGTEPVRVHIDPRAAPYTQDDLAIIPFTWHRLRFRTATANNGRRRNLQQHFVIKLRLIATTHADSQEECICDISSPPIIVRGRNPSCFSEKKEVIVGGSKAASRRGSHESRRRLSVSPGPRRKSGSGSGVGGIASLDSSVLPSPQSPSFFTPHSMSAGGAGSGAGADVSPGLPGEYHAPPFRSAATWPTAPPPHLSSDFGSHDDSLMQLPDDSQFLHHGERHQSVPMIALSPDTSLDVPEPFPPLMPISSHPAFLEHFTQEPLGWSAPATTAPSSPLDASFVASLDTFGSADDFTGHQTAQQVRHGSGHAHRYSYSQHLTPEDAHAASTPTTDFMQYLGVATTTAGDDGGHIGGSGYRFT